MLAYIGISSSPAAQLYADVSISRVLLAYKWVHLMNCSGMEFGSLDQGGRMVLLMSLSVQFKPGKVMCTNLSSKGREEHCGGMPTSHGCEQAYMGPLSSTPKRMLLTHSLAHTRKCPLFLVRPFSIPRRQCGVTLHNFISFSIVDLIDYKNINFALTSDVFNEKTLF